jgi:hypothetical protein
MAVKHTCTIKVRCWKQHTCVSCGGQFSYLFLRTVVGTAGTPAAATATAEANAKKRIAGDVDSHPCPNCGLYQPDMIGAGRSKAQTVLFALSVVVVAVLLILSASHALQDDVFGPAAAVAFAAIGLVQFFVDARRPNRNLAANRQVALGAMQRGALRLDKAGQTQTGLEEPWRPQGSLLGPAAFVLCLVALLAVPSPSIVRESQGWPFNRDCYPPIAGPGDSTCFYMRQTLQSVKGYFRGSAKATARATDGGPEFAVVAHSSDANWGDNIQVKSSEKSVNSRLWVTLDLPNKPELAGKQIQCHIVLLAVFPKLDPAINKFHEEQQKFEDDVTLQLGPPRSGSSYRTIWWFGTPGGMALFLVSGMMRIGAARRLKKQALPTSVFSGNAEGEA